MSNNQPTDRGQDVPDDESLDLPEANPEWPPEQGAPDRVPVPEAEPEEDPATARKQLLWPHGRIPSGILDGELRPWIPTREESLLFAPAPPLNEDTISPEWESQFLRSHSEIREAMARLKELELTTNHYDEAEVLFRLKKEVAGDWTLRESNDRSSLLNQPATFERLNLLRRHVEMLQNKGRPSRSEPFQVWPFQLAGALGLLRGDLVQLPNGAGKTLTAILAALAALPSFRSVHLVTINDYLAERDAQRAAMIAAPLGLSVFVLYSSETPGYHAKEYAPLEHSPTGIGWRYVEEWSESLTHTSILKEGRLIYGTIGTFIFAYLRQYSQPSRRDYWVAPGEHCLIADEADNVLIDNLSQKFQLTNVTTEHAETNPDVLRTAKDLADSLLPGFDYDDSYPYLLTSSGLAKATRAFGSDPYSPGAPGLAIALRNAFQAVYQYHQGDDYLVSDNGSGKQEIILINEGRLQFGKAYSDGLQQAIMAREGLDLQSSTTKESGFEISLKSTVILYGFLSGMTATAYEDEPEYLDYFGMKVLNIPAWNESRRRDQTDWVTRTKGAQISSIVDLVVEEHKKEKPRPVLIACQARTEALEIEEQLLGKKILCQPLLAENFQEEASIIAQAGQIGRVTVSAGMAGRGTDIRISPEAVERGGLMVIVSGRSLDRRKDEHLRGRAARHGLPGSSLFVVSLEDELMGAFGGPWVASVLRALGMGDEEIIESGMISRRIRSAQGKTKQRLRSQRRMQVACFVDSIEKQQRITFEMLRHYAECLDPIPETKAILQFAVSYWTDVPGRTALRGFVRKSTFAQIRERARYVIDVSRLVFQGERITPEDLERRLFEGVWAGIPADTFRKGSPGVEEWRDRILTQLQEHWSNYYLQCQQRYDELRLFSESSDVMIAQYFQSCDLEFHRMLGHCAERSILALKDMH